MIPGTALHYNGDAFAIGTTTWKICKEQLAFYGNPNVGLGHGRAFVLLDLEAALMRWDSKRSINT